MTETQPQRLPQDRYQWRLYTVAAAGASFFAGMLVNNWLERRIRSSQPPRRPGEDPER